MERAYLCPLICMLNKEEIIINNMYDILYNRAPQAELKTHASMHKLKDTNTYN